jgi:hypothetical protein
MANGVRLSTDTIPALPAAGWFLLLGIVVMVSNPSFRPLDRGRNHLHRVVF